MNRAVVRGDLLAKLGRFEEALCEEQRRRVARAQGKRARSTARSSRGVRAESQWRRDHAAGLAKRRARPKMLPVTPFWWMLAMLRSAKRRVTFVVTHV